MDKIINIITVSELNAQVKQLLEGNFFELWIQGEVSGITRSPLGHYYFTLKDDKAQVSCALFKYQVQKLNFDLKEGEEVQLTGKVTLYEPRGSYQIVVEKIEIKGLGKLYLEYARIKDRLEKSGYFDSTIKKPIPFFPNKIGIVTSVSGAAIHDILITLKRRMSQIEIIIYPTMVQGKGSELQIAKALQLANDRNEVEVLIVARGGGSLEDLWAFNEEVVVKAVYQSKIPIVSGVGHEIDFTLTDFAADLRAPTPTGAAELVSPDRKDLIKKLITCRDHLNSILLNRYHEASQYLDSLNRSLSHPYQILKAKKQGLLYQEVLLKKLLADKIVQQKFQLQQYNLLLQSNKLEINQICYQLIETKNILCYEMRIVLQSKKNLLTNLQQELARHQSDYHQYKEKLFLTKKILFDSWQHIFNVRRDKLQNLTQLLTAISPNQLLKRGYSIVMDMNGGIVSASHSLKNNQKLNIQFAEGKTTVMVVNNQQELFD